MTIPSLPSTIVSREYLRIGGGYGVPAAGASPAGGLDVDNAGNLAADGDLTINGVLSAGSTPQPLTNPAGEIDGARMQEGTLGPLALDPAGAYRVGTLELTNAGSSTVKLKCASVGNFKIVNENSNFLDLDVDHPAGAQVVRVFRGSTGSIGTFVVYKPNTTAEAFSVDADSEDVWIGNDCSAASFTDRSPVYRGGRPLDILRQIRSKGAPEPDEEFAEVDHATLGPLAVSRPKSDPETGQTRIEHGRNIGKQIVVNSAAILALLERIEALEQQVGQPPSA